MADEDISCFINSIPGLVNCSGTNTEDSDGIISLEDNSSSSDGSLDLTLTDAVKIDDPDYSLNNINADDPSLGFIIAKEDLRNKLVLFDTFEKDEKYTIDYISLNSEKIVDPNVTCIIYEELSEVDENYKYIKAYFPKIIDILPRGNYVSHFALKTNKKIGKNTFTNLTEKYKSDLIIKTSAVWGTLENNKYLDTAFNRSDYGLVHGVELDLEKPKKTD